MSPPHRGAPLGNHNALKHGLFSQHRLHIDLYGHGKEVERKALKDGFFASAFTPAEKRHAISSGDCGILSEIALLRVLIKRTVLSMDALSDLDRMDYRRGLRLITDAVACAEKLERIRCLVFESPFTLQQLLETAIIEYTDERIAAGLGNLDPAAPLPSEAEILATRQRLAAAGIHLDPDNPPFLSLSKKKEAGKNDQVDKSGGIVPRSFLEFNSLSPPPGV